MLEARILDEKYKVEFNKIVRHPLQSWFWGEFKKNMACTVERIGLFENDKLIDGIQIVFSKLPKSKYTVGYSAKSSLPRSEEFALLQDLAKKHNAIFIKFEPNCFTPIDKVEKIQEYDKALLDLGLCHGKKSIFKKDDFHLDIDRTEDELMASFHSKTRYNIRLATRKGVTIVDNTCEEGMENYIKLMEETTKRQKFFNHNAKFFRELYKAFPEENLRIFEAHYQDKVLTAWILYKFNGVLYYPYGASSSEHRDVMPNNLIAWEAIKYGKANSCKSFDLWGCLGLNPDKSSSWYGFHKFKAGYKPQLVNYIGTYDLVNKKFLYKAFHLADKVRTKILKFKSR